MITKDWRQSFSTRVLETHSHSSWMLSVPDSLLQFTRLLESPVFYNNTWNVSCKHAELMFTLHLTKTDCTDCVSFHIKHLQSWFLSLLASHLIPHCLCWRISLFVLASSLPTVDQWKNVKPNSRTKQGHPRTNIQQKGGYVWSSVRKKGQSHTAQICNYKIYNNSGLSESACDLPTVLVGAPANKKFNFIERHYSKQFKGWFHKGRQYNANILVYSLSSS